MQDRQHRRRRSRPCPPPLRRRGWWSQARRPSPSGRCRLRSAAGRWFPSRRARGRRGPGRRAGRRRRARSRSAAAPCREAPRRRWPAWCGGRAERARRVRPRSSGGGGARRRAGGATRIARAPPSIAQGTHAGIPPSAVDATAASSAEVQTSNMKIGASASAICATSGASRPPSGEAARSAPASPPAPAPFPRGRRRRSRCAASEGRVSRQPAARSTVRHASVRSARVSRWAITAPAIAHGGTEAIAARTEVPRATRTKPIRRTTTTGASTDPSLRIGLQGERDAEISDISAACSVDMTAA